MTVESCSATENRLAPTVPSDLALLVTTDSSESTSSHPQLIDEAATSSPCHPQQINMASTSSHPQLIDEAATSSPCHPQQINMASTSSHPQLINEAATSSPRHPQQINMASTSSHPQLIDEAVTSSPRYPQQINMASTSSHPQLIDEAATSSPHHPQQINMASTSSHPQLIDEAATSSPRHPQQINMASTSSHPQLINEAAASSPCHPQQINMERTSPHGEKINEATASPDPQQISISILSNITSVNSLPSPPLTHMWVQSLNLTVYDKLELLQGKWLTDKHINAANFLLKKQFQTQNGLEDPLVLSEKLICTSLSANFVQIINIKRQHWVCASNINCPAGVVDVYDSMPRMSYNCKILQKQLAALAKTIHRELEIRFIDVQHQVDSNDCGLFAIAFAQVLCCKIDPHLTSHSQIDRGNIWHNVLKKGRWYPFPLHKNRED